MSQHFVNTIKPVRIKRSYSGYRGRPLNRSDQNLAQKLNKETKVITQSTFIVRNDSGAFISAWFMPGLCFINTF